MKIPNRMKYMMLIGMALLALALRYPFTTHEIGWDSFAIHGMVNTLNHEGFFSWWIHPLSPFGVTPFSYPSSAPIIVSALSQASGLSIDSSIWLFGIICGITSVFGSYLVAKEIFKNDLYILLVVFAFITSEELLNYTTWTLSTRGLFITMLPFFLFFLFRKTKYNKINKYTFLVILFFVAMVSIHHLYSFLIGPIIVYIILIKINKIYPITKIIKNKKLNSYMTKIIEYIPIIIIFAIVSGLFAEIELVNVTEGGDKSSNELIIYTIRVYARNLGVLGLFGIFGFFCLTYKLKSNLNQMLLILFTIILTPFILISTYMTAFISIFIYLLAGFALYLIYITLHKRNMKIIGSIIIISILSTSLYFSAFYQVNHPGIQDDLKYDDLYMEENTYDTGLWLKTTINDSSFYSNSKTTKRRIGGVMYIKEFPGDRIDHIQFNYTSAENYINEVRSPFDPLFWSDEFYETKFVGPNLDWYGNNLPYTNYSDLFTQNIVNKYNIKYVVQNDIILKDNYNENSTFFITMNEINYEIYANERHSIWYIN